MQIGKVQNWARRICVPEVIHIFFHISRSSVKSLFLGAGNHFQARFTSKKTKANASRIGEAFAVSGLPNLPYLVVGGVRGAAGLGAAGLGAAGRGAGASVEPAGWAGGAGMPDFTL